MLFVEKKINPSINVVFSLGKNTKEARAIKQKAPKAGQSNEKDG